jgi:methyl-accepting chemotaxis protein
MISLTIGCSVAVLVFSVLLFNRELNNAMYEKVEVAATVVEHEINNLKARTFVAALRMANNPDLIEALVNKDLNRIISTAMALQTMAQLDYCTILDNEGIVFTRTHAPDSYGDSIAHLPQIRSAMAGRTESHIIRGPIVRLGISGGAPVYNEDGNIIGIVSLGFRLDTQDFAYNLKAMTGCEMAFFLDDERVSTPTYH